MCYYVDVNWILLKSEKKQLQTVKCGYGDEWWIPSFFMETCWIERKPNQEILEEIEEQRSHIAMIDRKRKTKFLAIL